MSRAEVRRTVFLAQEAVVLCTTLGALDDVGVLEPSLESDRSIADLVPDLTEPGFGSLRIAVRTLASEGWVEDGLTLDPETTVIQWTETGRLAARYRHSYIAVGRFLTGFDGTADDAWSRPWDAGQGEAYAELVGSACERWRLDADLPDELAALVRTHLDAALLVPTLLWLHESGRLGDAPELPGGELGVAMGGLLGEVGYVDANGGWTETGIQARAYAINFGGVATYMPMLARLPELYRGELTVAESNGEEWHVHRKLNITISAKAHHRYFGDTDAIFTELFDAPAAERPRFVADMGCGDGSWLAHVHELLDQLLDGPPLMVGIDASATTLERAAATLAAAGVDPLLLVGDVADPDALGRSLAEHGLAIEEGLHIRAFLDHDRAYRGADPNLPAPGLSTGAYIDADGRPAAAIEVERDLVAHLRRWAPHVSRHGMVLLETHCVPPQITRDNLGAMHSVAFDAYQAYSQQYPLEHDSFMRCCAEAGLRPDQRFERVYPSKAPFVTVSLNRLLA
jgi:hypothetical protein